MGKHNVVRDRWRAMRLFDAAILVAAVALGIAWIVHWNNALAAHGIGLPFDQDSALGMRLWDLAMLGFGYAGMLLTALSCAVVASGMFQARLRRRRAIREYGTGACAAALMAFAATVVQAIASSKSWLSDDVGCPNLTVLDTGARDCMGTAGTAVIALWVVMAASRSGRAPASAPGVLALLLALGWLTMMLEPIITWWVFNL